MRNDGCAKVVPITDAGNEKAIIPVLTPKHMRKLRQFHWSLARAFMLSNADNPPERLILDEMVELQNGSGSPSLYITLGRMNINVYVAKAGCDEETRMARPLGGPLGHLAVPARAVGWDYST